MSYKLPGRIDVQLGHVRGLSPGNTLSGSSYLRTCLNSTLIFLPLKVIILFFLFGSHSVYAANISGTVYEDKNYGGGSGRSLTASSGVVRQSARVELFNGAGNYVSFATTDVSGNYSFTGLSAGTYTIRVVNSSVTSSRGAGVLSVQTYRTNASSGAAVAVTDYVGGETPGKLDAGNGSTTLAALATATTAAQSVTTVVLGGSNITGIEFGYSFNVIVNNNNTGQGSLRQFITNANAMTGDVSLAQSGLIAGKDNAVFMISNGTSSGGLRSGNNYFTAGVTSIALTSVLADISTTMVINAQLQPGWTTSPIVELNGTNAGFNMNGLTVSASNCIIKGLVINRFEQFGITVTSNNNIIAGNYIGLNAAGTAASTNLRDGVSLIGSTGNLIGGSTASDRNVISGNSIAANDADGIWISGGSGNSVKGNYLGTNAAGTSPIANYHGGITITSLSTNNFIGGLAAGEGNLISGNAAGIILSDWSGVVTGNAILSNSIYGNTGLGIDIEATYATGVNANDGAKSSSVCNYGMDHPVFTAATLTGSTLTLTGYVGSAAGQAAFANATVQIFESDNDGSGFGEGQTFLGTLTTGGSNGNFSGSFSVSGLAVGDKITGTATDASNNTSEFGANATVTATISGTVFEDVNYGGGAGRSQAASSGVVRSGARVELYTSAGVYSTFQTTDVSGNYSFTGLSAATYFVRVVNTSVTSSRTGYTAGCLRVMTYRTDASSGTATAVTDYVGGTNPGVTDPGNSVAGSTFNTTTFVYTAGLAGTAQAVTRAVISTTGITAVAFGFNFNTIVNNNNTGQGSLRQFITNANILTGDASLAQAGLVAGKDNAVFMISNGSSSAGLRAGNNYFTAGVSSITLTSALPSLSSVMVLDAQEQPGWTLVPIIELNGNAAGASSGLDLSGSNCTVKGFVINRCGLNGIYCSSDNNTIAGNYVGLNAAGTTASTNLYDGIVLEGCSGNIIGGTTASDRNMISGNNTPAHWTSGIWIDYGSGNTVQGNYIGMNAAGSGTVANYYGGVHLTNTDDNTVGGLAAGAGNVISGSGFAGVQLITGSGNAILSNSIYGNTNLGIDFNIDGVTANNGTKTGTCNSGMDHPVFTTATLSGTTLSLTGYVGSAGSQVPFANTTVQVFKSDNDASGFGEGQTFLGTLTTGGSNGNFSGNLTVSGLIVGDKITGTATDASDNTSEFGANFTVTVPKTWDGGAGTVNWGDANNWNPNGVPTSLDNIDLNGAYTINANVAAVTNSLILSHASLILTINSGKSLVVSGNFTLTSGTLNTAAAFPTVAGTIDVSGGTVGFTGSGAQTIPAYNYNNLTSSSTGGRTLANSGVIGIAGIFTPGTNTYTITGSTIDYNTSGAQTIAGFNYNNLTLSNAGVKTFSSGTTGAAAILAIIGSATSNAIANSSTINYNGPSNQTATTLTYYNLNLTNGATVTAPATLNINGSLLMNSGTFTAGTTINVKGNWTNNGGTFTPGTGTVNFTGTGTKTIGGSNVTSFNNLTINTSASTDVVQLGNNATVTSVLNLTKGVLDLNSNSLSVTSGLAGAIARTNGYILSEQTDNSSKIIWNIGNNLTSHTYPFGTASGSYIPFVLNLTAGNIGNATISTYSTGSNNTPYPTTPVLVTNLYSSTGSDNSADVVDRFWQIEKDGASGTATITFTATAAEVGAILLPTAQRYESSTNKWQSPLPGQTSTAISATVPGVTTFSPWTMSSQATILPIQLVSFDAVYTNPFVSLAWVTESEINSDYYAIERTTDESSFETVCRVKAAGQSIETLNYQTTDKNPSSGLSYYRLKQVDQDGAASYSDLVAVQITTADEISISPNPASYFLNVKIESKEDTATLQVVNMTGQVVMRIKLNKESGSDNQKVDIHNLSPGLYYLTMKSGDAYMRGKFLKK